MSIIVSFYDLAWKFIRISSLFFFFPMNNVIPECPGGPPSIWILSLLGVIFLHALEIGWWPRSLGYLLSISHQYQPVSFSRFANDQPKIHWCMQFSLIAIFFFFLLWRTIYFHKLRKNIRKILLVTVGDFNSRTIV